MHNAAARTGRRRRGTACRRWDQATDKLCIIYLSIKLNRDSVSRLIVQIDQASLPPSAAQQLSQRAFRMMEVLLSLKK
jgi:hypothetical protein